MARTPSVRLRAKGTAWPWHNSSNKGRGARLTDEASGVAGAHVEPAVGACRGPGVALSAVARVVGDVALLTGNANGTVAQVANDTVRLRSARGGVRDLLEVIANGRLVLDGRGRLGRGRQHRRRQPPRQAAEELAGRQKHATRALPTEKAAGNARAFLCFSPANWANVANSINYLPIFWQHSPVQQRGDVDFADVNYLERANPRQRLPGKLRSQKSTRREQRRSDSLGQSPAHRTPPSGASHTCRDMCVKT